MDDPLYDERVVGALASELAGKRGEAREEYVAQLSRSGRLRREFLREYPDLPPAKLSDWLRSWRAARGVTYHVRHHSTDERGEGVLAVQTRQRGPQQALEWWRSLSSEQRGELIDLLHREQGNTLKTDE